MGSLAQGLRAEFAIVFFCALGALASPVEGDDVPPPPGTQQESRANPIPVAAVRAVVTERGVTAGESWAFEDLSHASAVDLDADGRRLVADQKLHRVFVFAADGRKLLEIETKFPVDADFLDTGGYLVTSQRDPGVREFDSGGSLVWQYRAVRGPLDADRLENGNTLIADTKGRRIVEVNPDGEAVWGHATGLRTPSDVELTAADEILVSDYDAHTVTCLRRDGSICWRFNEVGHPSSLQLRRDGTLLVSAHKAGSLLWIDRQRRVLGNWFVGRDLQDFVEIEGQRLLLAQMLRPGIRNTRPRVSRAGAAALAALRDGRPVVDTSGAGVRGVDGVTTNGKNIVLILFDSLRRDHVPWHGYWRDTAPNLRALAEEGLIFDQYITQAPWTKPSVASLLSSTYATVHGATSQTPKSHMASKLVTLAEALNAAGYHTAAIMENPHMGDRRSSKGFEQGYEHYEYMYHKKNEAPLPMKMTASAIKVLESRPTGKPFFLTMFFLNPHYPYEPQKLAFGNKAAGPSNPGPINQYDAEILEADHAVGELVDFLRRSGLAEDTLIVFSSDHGEEFGDHRNRFHGDTLYDCVIHVPFFISGLDRVGRFVGLVRQIDVMPTLLDYVGVGLSPEVRAQAAGITVRPLIEKGVTRTGLVAYSQSRFRDNVHLISERTEDRKVVVDLMTNTARIFDLSTDPQEYNDLSSPEISRREVERLRRWEMAQAVVADDEEVAEEPIPEDVLERLRAAGYLTDGGTP